MTILPSQYYWLSNIFSSSSIRSTAEGNLPKQVDFYIGACDSAGKTLSEVFDDIYRVMLKSYRNEYIYKNEIINRIRSERHDVAVSHIFSEFKTGNSRTDLAIFNGTSTCYEIKTEIDTVRRLEGQISDYVKFFEKVYIVVPESKLTTSLEILQSQVGVLLFDSDGRIETIREACSNIDSIEPLLLFRALHKKEYIDIASKFDSSIQTMGDIEAYYYAKEIFCSLAPSEAQKKFMELIRRRKTGKRDENYLDMLPRSLVNAFFSTKMPLNKWKSLINQLEVSAIKGE